ncbi:MAG TPA: IS4 family transposase [Rhizomicrobium sp.]|nr:IS4 family transposase [Rhizomicrobium sp.]
MRIWRFLANPRVTLEKLIEGWSDQTRTAVAGRHVLAIQDTSEIRFSTTKESRRGLGKVKKGTCRGVLLHAMLAVDADSGACLGPVAGKIWTRKGDVKVPHGKRALADKESHRWVTTADQGKKVLAEARLITVVDDREGEFYAHWARTPADNVHHLSRAMHDRALVKGGTLYKAVKRVAFCAKAVIDVPGRIDRLARKAHLSLRFGSVVLKRPTRTGETDLPESIALNFVEVIELHPPKGEKPIHWLLLTTHEVGTVAKAWQIVGWYKLRWIIEQFFRTMKSQGLRIEDSQLETAERPMKLVAVAAKAATIVIQLVQARNGGEELPAEFVFSAEEIEVLVAINKTLQGKTELQKNPHGRKTLAWAAWVIARLGGWTGYASHRPPGPITIHHGLIRFQAFAAGWALQNV